MNDPRTDAIAREAARLIDSSRATTIRAAIRAAAETLGFHGVDLPGPGRVRAHARALAMQALGDTGYADSVRGVWQSAERLMTALQHALPRAEPLLTGRAAQGLIDGGVTVYVRLYTDAPIGDLADALVEYGYDEPAFETVNTRLGRLSRIRLEDDGLELVVTRCLPHMAGSADQDLFSGRPAKTATLTEVRRKLAES
ncbi:MAG: hypothetical protein ACYSU7_06645 [Planctomycetota bacterium]